MYKSFCFSSQTIRLGLITVGSHCRCAHTYNHYEVLNVSKESTDKEIRDSFVKLSKQHHPDHSKTEGSAATFQRIMEAYRVLSKTETRRNYDMDIDSRPVYASTGNANAADAYDFEANKTRYRYSTDPNSYYGVDGMKKLSNTLIVLCILGFTAVGVVIQAVAIRSSFTFKREKLDQVSLEAHKVHTAIRAEVQQHDREEQLIRVLDSLKKR